MLAGIKIGITKISVGTAVRQEYEKGLRQEGSVGAAQELVREEIEDLIRNYFHIMGSAHELALLITDGLHPLKKQA